VGTLGEHEFENNLSNRFVGDKKAVLMFSPVPFPGYVPGRLMDDSPVTSSGSLADMTSRDEQQFATVFDDSFQRCLR